MSNSMDRNRRTLQMAAIAAVVALTALTGGCGGSRGSGKIATEIKNLPNGLMADTANARHTDQTLENTDPAAEGQ